MKYLLIASVSAVLLGSSSAQAAPPREVPWSALCLASEGQRLLVTMMDGRTADGYCSSTTDGELTLTNERGVSLVKIARTAIVRIRLVRPRKRRLWAFWKDLGPVIGGSFSLLFSDWALVGLAAVSVTVAWGAIATPYYASVDAADLFSGHHPEITLK